jgi:hypothetical protein
MKFSNKSKKLIEHFIPLMDHFIQEQNEQNKHKSDVIFKSFFTKIRQAEKTYNYLMIKKLIKRTLEPTRSTEELQNDSYLNSHYVPSTIRNFIITNTKYYLVYSFPIGIRTYKFIFGIYNEDDLNFLHKYDNYIHLIILWLSIISKISNSQCSKNLTILLYLTPFKKTLPTSILEILSPEHTNSAVTTSCIKDGKILIYRKEEWFKVLIHETFHVFGLDFSHIDTTDLSNKLLLLFPINSDMNVTETYSEFWACIMNAIFCSYNMLEDKTKVEEFILYCELCILFEKIFTLYQCVQILDYMNVRYHTLFRKNIICKTMRDNFYRENTNVFCYYILKSILMFNHYDFMTWCYYINGPSILNSKKNKIFFNELYKLIYAHYKSDNLLKALTKLYSFHSKLNEATNTTTNVLLTTTRMTICELV